MTTRNFSILSILLLALVTLQGCTMAKISGKGSKPLMLNNPGVQAEVVNNVDETKLKVFDYTGSIDIYEVLNEIILDSDADAVTNITISLKSDPATFFINVFTLGLANAYKVEVTGDLVTLPEGLAEVNPIEKEELSEIKPDPDKEVTTLHFDGFVTP